MIEVQENDSIKPICPWCEKELEMILAQKIKTFIGKRHIYYCPCCRKTLGISHRKSNWIN